MNVNQDEYISQAGDTAGVRLVVLDQNQLAFPEDEGVTISPGFETLIGIKQVRRFI